MSAPLLLAIGFGAGFGVALLFHVLRRRRRVPPASPTPSPPLAKVRSAPVRPAPNVEREVAAVWLQFLRREVADTVSAINTRLTVVKALLAEVEADASSPGHQATIERLGVEVDRATAATDTLHAHVSSTAPERALPSVTGTYTSGVLDGVVLLVESDDTTRDVLGQLLRRLGHRVLTAQNGIEALDLLDREPVGCIVSETRASNVSGSALHAQVEERLPHLARRFVFISGDTQVPEVREFLERCNCPVIPKPFDVALLLDAVNAVLETVERERRGPASGAALHT